MVEDVAALFERRIALNRFFFHKMDAMQSNL